ncbi:MAG TPA: type IV pilin protein [Burkholderiaceae bacterium]|nr:type IV pilin protein [Burkholderiaceae bacterium]
MKAPSLIARRRGFTLIEVMVIVVIASILAAIAIPSYTQYVVRGKRTAAKAAILEAAGVLERNRTRNGCYNKSTIAVCQSQASGSNFALPTTMAPVQRGSYILTMPTLAATTFTLNATPCGTAGTCGAGHDTSYADAECGTYTLTETGARGLVIGGTASSNAALIARCWQR